MKKVFLVTYGGSHAKMIHAVATALQERPSVEPIVLALTTAKHYFEKNSYHRVLTYRDFSHLADASYVEYGKILAEKYHTEGVGIDFQDSVAYLGINFRELVEKFGEKAAYGKLAEDGRHAFLPIAFMDRVLDEVKPDVVVSTNSPKSERAVVNAAKARGIPTVSIVDLFGDGDFYVPEGNKICVLSNITKQFYLDAGVPEHMVKVTGNPMFDKLYQTRKSQANQTSPDKGTEQEGPALLWCDQPGNWLKDRSKMHTYSEADTVRCLNSICNAALQAGFGSVYIRPHPSQDRSIFSRFLTTTNDPRIVDGSEVDLYELLYEVDAMATRTSTTALEALLLNTPVLLLSDPAEYQPLKFVQYGLALESKGLPELYEGLSSLIKFAQKGSDFERKLLGYFPYADERSTERVLEVILS